MKKKSLFYVILCTCLFCSCEKEEIETSPVVPPVEQPDNPDESNKPENKPSTEDIINIKINENTMAIVGTVNWNDIAYGNGKYVAVGNLGYIAYSENGDEWSILQKGNYNIKRIIFDGSKFVTYYMNSSGIIKMITSIDGKNWTEKSAQFTRSYIIDIVYHSTKKKYILLSENTDGYVYVLDENLSTFTKSSNRYSSAYCLKLFNDKVLIGSSGYIYASTNDDFTKYSVVYTQGGAKFTDMFIIDEYLYPCDGKRTKNLETWESIWFAPSGSKVFDAKYQNGKYDVLSFSDNVVYHDSTNDVNSFERETSSANASNTINAAICISE